MKPASCSFVTLPRSAGAWLLLRSGGTVFKRRGRTTASSTTGLMAVNEPEGLVCDAATRTLLVACKGAVSVGLRYQAGRVSPRTLPLISTTSRQPMCSILSSFWPAPLTRPAPVKLAKRKAA